MKAKQDPISEFTSLSSQLQKAPENIALKQALLKRLPEMKALAAHNSLALYRLAQSYAENSPQYRQMMLGAADRGCTNAMLDACKLLLRSADKPNIKQALSYLKAIALSGDTFIKHKTAEWLAEHPQFQKQLSAKIARGIDLVPVRFFKAALSEAVRKEGPTTADTLTASL